MSEPQTLYQNHEGRGIRLARVIELIEACQELGDGLDPAIAQAVLEDAEQQLLQEQNRAVASLAKGSKLPDPRPEDFRDAAALIMAARIVYDVVACMQLRKQPGRLIRLASKTRDCILEEIVKPLLLSMSAKDASALMEHAGGWDYTLWSPQHKETLNLVLQAVARGGCVRREVRDGAQYFVDMLIPATERDKERRELGG